MQSQTEMGGDGDGWRGRERGSLNSVRNFRCVDNNNALTVDKAAVVGVHGTVPRIA